MNFTFEEAQPVELGAMGEVIEQAFRENMKGMVEQALVTGNVTYQIETDDPEHMEYLHEQFDAMFRLEHTIEQSGKTEHYRVFAAKQDEELGASFTLSARFLELVKTQPQILELF